MTFRSLAFLGITLAVVFGQQAPAPATGSRDLVLTEGRSVLVDSMTTIERVSVASAAVAEAIVVSPEEILVNGLAPGETSMIVWQAGGNRLFFDVTVQRNESRVDAIRRELAREEGLEGVTIERTGDDIFLRGVVPDLTKSQRAVMIASTLGDVVNLLNVQVPATEAQVLLKVRFADVDRSRSDQLGINLFSTGATGTVGSVSTGQFFPPQIQSSGAGGGTTTSTPRLNLQQALNVFLFRPDLNLGATIQALQAQNLLQILAEPNVLALNGHSASFLAGGEFPYPTLQGGGGGLGAVTIQFREFGVRINFTPTLTPRGTIRLSVTPEVSALDYANGLVFQGNQIPGLSTRRVQTEIELEDGQSFAIGGLLDNRDTEVFNRIPGLANIPFFGNLFRSRQINKSNSELLVLVTPEIVRPIPKGQPLPDLNRPGEFLPPNTSSNPPRTPGIDQTGPVPLSTPLGTMPVEELSRVQQAEQGGAQGAPVQYVPVLPFGNPIGPQQGAAPAGASPPAAPAPPPAPAKP